MHRPRSLLIALALAFAALLGAGQASADAAATRVVALEWDAIENLMVLGVTPVGGADLAGYDQWVPVGRSRSITDVGLRTAPSLTRIASLRPDLIIAPDYRTTTNLSSLRRIAPVLVTHPYPRGGNNAAQYNAMVSDFRRIATAVGKRAQGEAVLRDLDASIRSSRLTLRAERRSNIQVTLSAPGGSIAAPGLRIFTNNAVPWEVMRRLGLRNPWTGANQQYGYATVGVEALRTVQGGWLAFIYPEQFRGLIERFTSQSSFRRLSFVRGNRVRQLPGTTWLYGGPRTIRLFTERLTAALVSNARPR